ncbi:Mitochondrial DNA replication protein yhm2 [Pichia californica]|uniref:Mitochondrial DNA replication protein yhm2 n=1 Tax=Pichia californica TaxID=460514 RepID=A0A9P7BHL5_9ASCO|nr:Mitochondrial DNA replication protein yhm2 [[Candida] californica]KAG0690184.1 Mitochondrial DNA replication protein yhm2 [[Candida] californica]
MSEKIEKKPITFSNLLLGAGLNLAEVSSLGQPLEVTKTTMAAHRDFGLIQAVKHIWKRGGVLGFYQGLIPWAWFEASTKGAVLLAVMTEGEYQFRVLGASPFISGIGGGMLGGLSQAYLTMGFCTCMKTVEITRSKSTNSVPKSTFTVFKEIYQKEGIRGINKGVNAVAMRQCTNWGSRFGLARLAEDWIKTFTNKGKDEKLNAYEKILSSIIGGGLSAWNQPFEVARVEMQSRVNDPNRPKNLNVLSTLKYVYNTNGIKGLYKGVTPRIGLGVWQTIFMVSLGDYAKEYIANWGKSSKPSTTLK